MAWAKFPTAWIKLEQKLTHLSWRVHKSDATAALIIIIALAIRLNQRNMKGRSNKAVSVPYDDLQSFTGLSRAKISSGITLLRNLGIIEVRNRARTNSYILHDVMEPGSWAQLPQTTLLKNGILLFSKFQLRHRNELNALKLYLLLIAHRNARGNFTALGYEKICEYSGLQRNDIVHASSLLINFELITSQDEDPIQGFNGRPHKRYRICGLDKVSPA